MGAAMLAEPRCFSQWSDEEIKEIARNDRRQGMALVVGKYRERLYFHAFSIVRERQEAYDAVQEVFIKAMRERRLFDPDFGLRAWLFRVTTNLCYNIVRDKRRRAGILDRMPDESVPQGTCRSSRDVVYAGQLRDELLGALDVLSPDHRRILLLRYYQDLSYNEIAEELDIKLGTVMSRLSRARARLSEVVGPDHPLSREPL
ncbi:MAG: RNA polymerase sigma factor [Alphaproteobacteria bacterium]|nr:RNA polymerase sigma factor [Alphaproteobacteria bacterium]